jgi:hypothetical protein
MADHVAEQAIAAAKTVLTGLATTGTNVFDSLVYELQESQLPALLVDQGDEQLDGQSLGLSRLLERSMDLIVVAKVKQNTSYRTRVNTIRKEVEIALAGDNTLGGVVKFITPTSCQIELSGEGEKPVAAATMRFRVVYITALGAPDVPL